ncbi:hypothetical protein TNCV_770771 [Trichonephila clavipes]|nr:hypothetical protein TNCV_770771 [Trichonephila clavipes]
MRGESDGGVTSGSVCAARLEGFSGRPSAVPTQEKFRCGKCPYQSAKKYISAVPTDSSSFQQALTDSWFTDSWFTDSWSRTAVHVLVGEKEKCLERRNLVETA